MFIANTIRHAVSALFRTSHPYTRHSFSHTGLSATRVFSVGLVGLTLCQPTTAQSVEGTSYYLPKAVVRFTVKVEKTDYEPGRFAQYARRYLKKDVAQEPSTSYRLLGLSMDQLAVPDTARHFTLLMEKKRSITKVARDEKGQLLGINADIQPAVVATSVFTPAPKPQPLNPNDYMSEDILNAGSPAKMAELTAREIYDIRDSRNQLNRGQADFMPRDGTQMRLMLANLDKQEEALGQLFEGTVTKDTTWTTVDYLPAKEGQEVLFRFSRKLGLTDSDDLAGAPYYINVRDNHTVAAPRPTANQKKEDKNDIGLRVAQPGKITISITNGTRTIATYEVSAPQFGTIESLSGELFGKKQSSRIVLDPLTGSIKTIEAIAAE